jgi:Phage gp6-like head-tail connector protein
MPGLKVETPPICEPVTLQMLKDHMRVSDTLQDELIGVYLQSVRTKVEGFLGRSLINKGYVQSLDHFPHYHGHDRMQADSHSHYYLRGHRHPLEIKLARSPLMNVSKVEYLDLTGVMQTLVPRIDAPWQSETAFLLGAKILDSNGNIQEVTTIGETNEDGTSESGATVPTWATSLNATTGPDGALTWTCRGTAPVGDFIVDYHGEPGRIFPNVNVNSYFWPVNTQRVPNAVHIHFTAGYGDDPAAVPGIFKTAIMIYVKGLYDFRDPFITTPGAKPMEMPSHLRDLLWEDRIKDFSPTEG